MGVLTYTASACNAAHRSNKPLLRKVKVHLLTGNMLPKYTYKRVAVPSRNSSYCQVSPSFYIPQQSQYEKDSVFLADESKESITLGIIPCEHSGHKSHQRSAFGEWYWPLRIAICAREWKLCQSHKRQPDKWRKKFY